MRVLLVDVDHRLRTTLVGALIKAWHQVANTPDAERALALSGMVPDLLGTDVNLGPGLDGVALAAEARRRWPLIRVIVISDDSSNLIGQSAGTVDCFLLKPFHAGALVRGVAELTAELFGAPR